MNHPDAVDKNGASIPQGWVEISLEILPKSMTKECDNGMGRDSPNNFPILPEPKGRFAFVNYHKSILI